jgi:4-azaleucine resistance transporter AzlC
MATAADAGPSQSVAESRRRLLGDGLAIASYALPVGLVYGLATREANFSLLDVVVSCVVVLAGGAQFAAAGLVKEGTPWLAIAGVTALVNARHLLYSAALTPYMATRSRRERAVMAHCLTDETFALSLAHFRRIHGFDARGYWIAALVILIPWTLGSAIGYLAAGAVDINKLALDVAFPAAMAGLSLGMVSGRRDVAAALGAVAVAVLVGLVAGGSVGLVAGAVVGPFIGLMVPVKPAESDGSASSAGADALGPEGIVEDATERAAEEGLP